MGIQTGNTDKKSTTSKNDNTEEKHQNKQRKVTQQLKLTIQLDKSEITGDRKKTKKISRQDQTIQTKQDISKQKKILPASRRRMHKDILDTKEAK